MLHPDRTRTTLPGSWRLIIDTPADGATNMARDEALLHAVAAGARPVLRLYAWQPACLSLGRFQRSSGIDRDAAARAGIDLVRRPSGGRAILHDDELTYALVAPAGGPLAGGVRASCRAIGQALHRALAALGVSTDLAPPARSATRHGRDVDIPSGAGEPPARLGAAAARHSPVCFDHPGDYELTWQGRKLVGSAQVRQHDTLLQHGSILRRSHAGRIATLLAQPAPSSGSMMAALDEILGDAPAWSQLAEALAWGVQTTLGVTLEPDTFTAAEQLAIARLRSEKYTADTWTYAR